MVPYVTPYWHSKHNFQHDGWLSRRLVKLSSHAENQSNTLEMKILTYSKKNNARLDSGLRTFPRPSLIGEGSPTITCGRPKRDHYDKIPMIVSIVFMIYRCCGEAALSF